MLCLPKNPNIGLTLIPRIVLKLWGKGTLFVKSDWFGEAKIYYITKRSCSYTANGNNLATFYDCETEVPDMELPLWESCLSGKP
jgi:hypothetical protein